MGSEDHRRAAQRMAAVFVQWDAGARFRAFVFAPSSSRLRLRAFVDEVVAAPPA